MLKYEKERDILSNFLQKTIEFSNSCKIMESQTRLDSMIDETLRDLLDWQEPLQLNCIESDYFDV